MIEKDKLKSYANKLMFDMNDKEYETLQNEFEIFLKWMDLIADLEEVKAVTPMTFPFTLDEISLRDDETYRNIDVEDALSNCHDRKGDEVRVPRVVE